MPKFILIALALLVLGLASGCAIAPQPTTATQPALSSQAPEPSAAYPTPMPPYPLGSPGPAYPQPNPTATPDATGAARIAANATSVAVYEMTLAAEPSGTPMPTLSAEQKAAYLADTIANMKKLGAIMLDDNGKTFTYYETERFFVFLDDEKYPRDELVCVPQPVIGYVSNGDFRGPDLYPIYYEATIVGSCTLKDRDFAVKIVVKALPTAQP